MLFSMLRMSKINHYLITIRVICLFYELTVLSNTIIFNSWSRWPIQFFFTNHTLMFSPTCKSLYLRHSIALFPRFSLVKPNWTFRWDKFVNLRSAAGPQCNASGEDLVRVILRDIRRGNPRRISRAILGRICGDNLSCACLCGAHTLGRTLRVRVQCRVRIQVWNSRSTYHLGSVLT